MNEIIKNIEAAQMKESVPEFRVGDTVKVYNKIKQPGENPGVRGNRDQAAEWRRKRDLYRP